MWKELGEYQSGGLKLENQARVTYVRLKQKNREGKVQLMGEFSNLYDC